MSAWDTKVVCVWCSQQIVTNMLRKHLMAECRKSPHPTPDESFCSICQLAKPRGEFYKSSIRRTGIRSACIACHQIPSSWNNYWMPKDKPKRNPVLRPCPNCGEQFGGKELIKHRAKCKNKPPRKKRSVASRTFGKMRRITCSFCSKEMPITSFQPHLKDCLKCPAVPLGNMICTKCQTIKSLSEFPMNSTKIVGVEYTCKECFRQKVRDWYSNPENRTKRKHFLMKKLCGLDPETYQRTLDAQQGRCAICRKIPDGLDPRAKTLHVDHCHTTGKFRGLLCTHCNHGIGNFMDNPALLIAAINYLTAFQELPTAS